MKLLVLVLSSCLFGCATGTKAPAAKAATTPSAAAVSAPVAAPAVAKAPASAPDLNKISCTRGKETRGLEIVDAGKGCKLNYTKADKTQVAASSSVSTKHCIQSQGKIRTALEKAGFKCQ